MHHKLFGTDGIRGRANVYPMTTETALKAGRAAAAYFMENETSGTRIIIGKDTRISGDMLECALAAGICSMGVDVYLTGVLPTPGIAYLTAEMNFAAGIVISASHNPYYDNGIKFFNSDGFKLGDAQEEAIEALILGDALEERLKKEGSEKGMKIGRVYRISDAVERYADFLASTAKNTAGLDGCSAVIDCANGATYQVAPILFKKLGLTVHTLFDAPNGENINADCGSQHPETLAKKVKTLKADIGLAFDGDGDRLIAVDETGAVLSGDQILAVCARHLKQLGQLKDNQVVSTIMSNVGLGQALNKMGVAHKITQVGDRYVLEEMLAAGAVLGGEDSGHMIFLDYHSTGDGILAAVRLLAAMAEEKRPLSQMAALMTVFPQVLMNVDVSGKPDLNTLPAVTRVIAEVEQRLGPEGRVLVRYSGTQPKCRVMVEAPEMKQAQAECRCIVEAIQQAIGV